MQFTAYLFMSGLALLFSLTCETSMESLTVGKCILKYVLFLAALCYS